MWPPVPGPATSSTARGAGAWGCFMAGMLTSTRYCDPESHTYSRAHTHDPAAPRAAPADLAWQAFQGRLWKIVVVHPSRSEARGRSGATRIIVTLLAGAEGSMLQAANKQDTVARAAPFRRGCCASTPCAVWSHDTWQRRVPNAPFWLYNLRGAAPQHPPSFTRKQLKAAPTHVTRCGLHYAMFCIRLLVSASKMAWGIRAGRGGGPWGDVGRVDDEGGGLQRAAAQGKTQGGREVSDSRGKGSSASACAAAFAGSAHDTRPQP
jgi:hypothetical protein